MFVTTAVQPDGTYDVWKLFKFPSENGPQVAFAVPAVVAHELNSAYTTMLNMAMAQFWALIIATAVAILTCNKKTIGNKGTPIFSPLIPSLWNNKSNIIGSVYEVLVKGVGLKDTKDGQERDIRPGTETGDTATTESHNKNGGKWKIYLALVAILVVFAGQTTLTTIIPPKLILGNAAPVRQTSIYVPQLDDSTQSRTAARVALEVPWALRAAGAASVGRDQLRKYVNVSREDPVWFTSSGQPMTQLTYGYNVSGADMGLQKFPGLMLHVSGSCRTEYGWQTKPTATGVLGGSIIAEDFYDVFGKAINVSLFQGTMPLGIFLLNGTGGVPGQLPHSNASWAAVISSLNRTSFTSGSDPWYLTTSTGSSVIGAGYTVVPGRPVLSCWEDNVWSYQGASREITNINDLPGLELSLGMQSVLQRYLSAPMIVEMSNRLGASALTSARTALGQSFDAGASSIYNDLEQLILASYIATTNVLATSTMYPPGASSQVPNMVTDEAGQASPGVADFIVRTPDSAALSLLVVVVIPALLVGLLLFLFILTRVTPLGKVEVLNPTQMFEALFIACPNIGLESKIWEGGKWIPPLSSPTPPEARDNSPSQAPLSEDKRVAQVSVTQRSSPSPEELRDRSLGDEFDNNA